MSITDELREFASHCAGGMGGDSLRHIADRIDAEHERLMAERRRSCVFYDAERNYCMVHDEVDMADFGWIRLPKDADGEYIHIGDRMENNERVARIVLTDDSWEPSVYLEKLPNVLHEYFCNEVSHYHAPSVEDVLREFGRGWHERMVGPETFDIADYVERYAAKLRLAGDAE